MFCAQTVAAAIEAKRVEEMIQAAIAKAKKEQEDAAKRIQVMQEFTDKVMPEVDAFFEQKLVEGKGEFKCMIHRSHSVCDKVYEGFVNLVRPAAPYRGRPSYEPFWSYWQIKDWEIHLDTYIEHLRSLCFEVTIEEHPWTGWSSTGKTFTTMDGTTIVVRVPKELPCT
jgi:hypothetical protein